MNLGFVPCLTDADLPSAIAGQADCILGGVRIGAPGVGPGPEWPQQFIPAPLIGATADHLHEIWRCATPCSSGGFADIAWRRAGLVLYGVLEVAESDFPGSPACSPLQAASQEAYRTRLSTFLVEETLEHIRLHHERKCYCWVLDNKRCLILTIDAQGSTIPGNVKDAQIVERF